MDQQATSNIVLLHGNSHPELANLIGRWEIVDDTALTWNELNFIYIFMSSSRLNIKSGGCSVYHKTNRETMVDIGDSVRGKDCYIIQTGTK